MTLEQIKSEYKPGQRICRKCNYKPYNYMPVFFTVKNDVLMVHDMDTWAYGGSREGKPATFQTSDNDDWMLY